MASVRPTQPVAVGRAKTVDSLLGEGHRVPETTEIHPLPRRTPWVVLWEFGPLLFPPPPLGSSPGRRPMRCPLAASRSQSVTWTVPVKDHWPLPRRSRQQPRCHLEATSPITVTAFPLVGDGVPSTAHRAHDHGSGGRGSSSGRPRLRGALPLVVPHEVLRPP